MQAITFDGAIPRYLLTLAAGRVSPGLLTGTGRCTYRSEVEEPALPGSRWVKVRTRLGGICGSDLNLVKLSVSPSASPFSSFPFVIGHENVGEVVEVGAGVTETVPGRRVVVNPLLPCAVRGLAPCPQCGAGRVSLCERFTEGDLAPGMMIGTTRGLGGSWGEVFVAHEEQLHPVPDGLSDEAALMLEPFATLLSPLLAHPPPGERVLVIGAGTMGQLAVAALRALDSGVRVTVLARHRFQAEHAESLGAERIVLTSGGTRYFDELAAAAGGRLLQPILGKRVCVGGFDATVTCAASGAAVDDALRFTRGAGTVYLVGNVARLPGVDWTPAWMKALTVRGSVCYDEPRHGGAAARTFDRGMALLSDGWGDKLAALVTDRLSPVELERALAICFGRGRSRSIKVAFDFRS